MLLVNICVIAEWHDLEGKKNRETILGETKENFGNALCHGNPVIAH